MEEEYTYELDCEVCGSVITMTVVGEDELPAFCPMCGADQSSEWTGPLYK